MKSGMESAPAAKGHSGTEKDAIILAKARPGLHYRVVGVSGGGEVQLRLASLGILPGQKIRIVQPSDFGPVMIAVKGSKLALGRGVSHKIMVRPVPA
jgi:Fe2+ transport system protein FeoA